MGHHRHLRLQVQLCVCAATDNRCPRIISLIRRSLFLQVRQTKESRAVRKMSADFIVEYVKRFSGRCVLLYVFHLEESSSVSTIIGEHLDARLEHHGVCLGCCSRNRCQRESAIFHRGFVISESSP